MTKLSLCIINYNDNEYIPQLMASLAKQKVNYEKIVFIDNHSKTSPQKEVLKWNKKLPITYIENKRNLFFSPGNNIGLRLLMKQDQEIIGIINADMYFENDCFAIILDYFEKNPGVVAVQPRLYVMGTQEFNAPPFRIGLTHFEEKSTQKTTTTDSLCGAGLFVRKSALEKTGLFYEPFLIYGEDALLTARLQQWGKTIWLREAVGHHRVGVNNNPTVKKNLFCRLKTRNDVIFSIKAFQSRPTWIFWQIVLFFKEIVLWAIGYKNRNLRKQYIYGYGQGFTQAFYHLKNNEKYLTKGMNERDIPTSLD